MPVKSDRAFDSFPAAWHNILYACLDAPDGRLHQIQRWYQTDEGKGSNYAEARYLCKQLRAFFKSAHAAGKVPASRRLVTRIRQREGEPWLSVSVTWVPWGEDRSGRKSSEICEIISANLGSSSLISIDSPRGDG